MAKRMRKLFAGCLLLTLIMLAMAGVAAAETAAEFPALEPDTSVDVIIQEAGEVKWFSFVPETSGVYRFEAEGDYDNKAAAYTDPAGEPIAENDDRAYTSTSQESEKSNFQLDVAMEAGQTYYLSAQMCYDDTVGDFSVKISFLHKAIASVEVLQEPRLTYYNGYDTRNNLTRSGAVVQVTFTDESSEIYNNTRYNYQQDGQLYVTYDVSSTYRQGFGGNYGDYLNPGNFTLTLNFNEWKQSYQARVVSADQIPHLMKNESVTTGASYGEWFRFTPDLDGYYLLYGATDFSYRYYYFEVYDSDLNALTSVNENSESSDLGRYGQVFLLRGNETYLLYLRNQEYYSYSMYGDSRIQVSVTEPVVLTEEFQTGQNTLLAKFIPETRGSYTFHIGFSSSGYNYDGLKILNSAGEQIGSIYTDSQVTYPSGYNRNTFDYDTAILEAGETYYLFFDNYSGWASCMQAAETSVESVELQDGITQEGVLASGNARMFLYTADETAYYHLRMAPTNNTWDYNVSYSNYYYSGNHSEKDGAGNSKFYRDCIWKISKGKMIQISIENEEEEEQAYELYFEKLPAVTQLTISKMPDNTTFLRTNGSISSWDLTGMELTAVYSDGQEETIPFTNDNSVSSRNGIFASSLDLDTPTMYNRIRVGSQTVTIEYLSQSVGCEINVIMETLPDDLPTLVEGEEMEGELTSENEYDVWFQARFTPEKTGTYQLTGSYEDYLSLYLYNGNGEYVTPLASYSNGYDYDITWYMRAGETYLLEGRTYPDSDTYSYTLLMSLVKEGYEENTITPGVPAFVSITDGIPVWFTFTPEETARYCYYSYENSGDSYGEVYVGDTQVAYNDDGGDGNNFRLAYTFQAGVTYRLKARMYNSAGSGSYYVMLTEMPTITSMEILQYPSKLVYTYPYDDQIDYDGLQIKAVLDDEIEETLYYYSTSQNTGEYVSVSLQNAVYDENRYLMPGVYDVLVSYGDKTATFQITVIDAETELTVTELAVDGETLTGEWTTTGDIYLKLTPPTDGYYQVGVYDTDYYASHSLYIAGSSDMIYSQTSYYQTWTDADEKYYYGYDYVYYLNQGQEYVLRIYKPQTDETVFYAVSVSSIHEMTPEREETITSVPGQANWFTVNIENAGFYRYSSQATGNDYSLVPSYNINMTSLTGNGNNNYGGSTNISSSTIEGSSVTTYIRESDYFYYLPKGQYLLRNSNSASTAFQYTHRLNRMYGEAWPVSYSSVTGISRYDAAVITVPEGAGGTYTFQIEGQGQRTSYNTLYAYLYSADSSGSIGYTSLPLNYDNELEGYYYRGNLGATLEEGKSYLLRVNSNYEDVISYQVTVSTQVQPVSIEITKLPKQRYYYKLENVTADTSLQESMQIQVTYSDGDSETLYAYDRSSKTGLYFDLRLPEDADFNASGYLKPGTYQAKLTYMDFDPIDVPITVVTIDSMPKVVLDGNGQGSYTGTVEEESGYGFIRFISNADGFYNLTLSVDNQAYISYQNLYNSAYKPVTIGSTSSSSTDNRYMVNARTYVRKGQTCYIRYYGYTYYSSEEWDRSFTLTVERATDVEIIPVSLNIPQQITAQSGEQWYSYTVDDGKATYYLNTIGEGYYYPSVSVYASPDASSQIGSYNYGATNGSNRRYTLSNLTAGKTYYFKVPNSSYNYNLILVKQSSPASLELLTEGDVFCSTIESNVDRSFVDLLFRITYTDGTTEEMTYGYNHTTELSYSLMGSRISVNKPNWKLNEDGTIKTDEEYIVRFHIGGVYADVKVIPRSIEDLDDLTEAQTVTISGNDSQYYRFTPAENGYYRFVAEASSWMPGISLYNSFMAEQSALFTNSFTEGNTRNNIKVFELTAGEIYCLRITNPSDGALAVTFAAEKLSPVATIEADGEHLPQTNYYLGIDKQYSDEGLPVFVTYEDGTTETIVITGGVGLSANTGLKMQTSLSTDSIIHTLGTMTGERTVYISYMGETGTYTITVSDSDTIPALKAGQWSDTLELNSAQDSAYMKFIAEESGFYRFNMRTETAEINPIIEAVKNSSYTDLTLAARSEEGNEVSVYLLEGKTYYLKGYLQKNGERSGGSYAAMVARITDLRDGVQQGNAPAGGHDLYQFTTDEMAYYQFTLDGLENMKLTVYGSSMSAVSMTTGQRAGADAGHVRKYYAAKLQASSSYLVAVQNPDSVEGEYAVFAGLKPAITSVEISSEPEKTLFYASFDYMKDVSTSGLVLTITYEDGESEELAYGKRSSWGIGMTLDLSAIQADANGALLAGDYPVTVTYLDKTAEYTVQVKALDPETLPELEEDTPIEVSGKADESAFYRMTAARDSSWRLYSRNASTALRATLYDGDGKQIQAAIGEPDFSLISDLTEGATYILRIQTTEGGQDFTGMLHMHDTALSTEVTGVNIQKDGATVDAVYLSEANTTVQLTALISPEDADNRNVTWESADETVATVDENGLVTLLKLGSTEITVTTEDGGYTASCRVVGDDELPRITNLQPASGTTIGPEYRDLYALTHDNNGTEKIELSIRKKGTSEWREETWSDRDEDDYQDSTIQITLRLQENDGTALYAHGDTIEVELVPVDKSGNRGEKVSAEYVVDLHAPAVQDLTGSYNTETVSVDLAWNIGEEPVQDADRFAVYRKAAEDTTWKRVTVLTAYADKTIYTWTDNTVANADAQYQYKLVSYDKYGNQAESEIIDVTTTFEDQLPKISLNAPGMAISGNEVTVNLTGTEDDLGISEIEVDFGDGNTETDAEQLIWTHTYQLDSGNDYEDLTLTVSVTDTAGQTATATHALKVVNASQAGVLYVTVADTDGIPVPNAPVYFNLGEDNEEILQTDRSGKVTFIGAGGTEDSREGFHKVGVLKNGYLPEMKSVKMTNGEETAVSFVVTEQEIIQGQFEAHRMTLDEIRDAAEAGYIDLDDPASYHTMQYNVTLEYGTTIHFNYCGGTVFNVSGGGGYIPYVVNDDIVLVLKVPVAASILKEFYEVKLYIINNASSAFSLLDSQAELFIDPESGMTVMENRNPALVELGNIPGQSTKEVEWILRGDEAGKYKVSADFSGTLSEFNKLITAHFEGEKELEVRGVADLEIVMQIPDAFTNGEFYYNLKMSNVAEEDNESTIVYLPGLNGEGELIQTSAIKQGETTPTVMKNLPETLKAGETVQRFYRITDQISKQLQQYPNYTDFVFHFRKAMVEEVTQTGVPLKVEVLPADELYAMYQQYRAVPPEVTLAAPEQMEYGYSAEAAVLTATAVPAENATYELSYTWYDTHYTKIGEGETLTLPEGLLPGQYDYHCVVRATREDNGHTADTDYVRITVEVEPRTVELTWTDDVTGMVYDGTEKSVAAGMANGIGSDVIAITVENGTATNAGTYVAKAVGLTGNDADKYRLPGDPELISPNNGKSVMKAGSRDEEITLSPTEYAYTIEPKEVGLAWTESESMVYSGTEKSVTAQATGLVGDDVCAVTVEGGTAVNAGNYTATASGVDNTNYKLPEEASHPYTIEQLEAVLAWTNDEDLIYDGQPKNVSATVSNAVTINGVKDDVTVVVSGGAETNANTEEQPFHTAVATGLSGEAGNNYKLPEAEEDRTHQYTIAPKKVGLSWAEADSMVYDGTEKSVTASATELVEGDTCAVTAEGTTAVYAGTYTARAISLDNTNYCLPEEVTYEYTIERRTTELSWAGTEDLVYDGQPKQVTASISNPVTIADETDEVAVTVTGGDAVNAGTYTATASELSGKDAANYQLPEENTKDYTIAPKGVTVTFVNTETRTYDGTASNVQATVNESELIGEDQAGVTVSGGNATDAGTHTAEATAVDNGNYTLTGTLTQDYTILPITAELTWSGDLDLVYNGQAKAVTAAVSNALENDEVHVTVTGGDAVSAGTHTATAMALDNSNYQLPEDKDHSYTIEQLEAVLTWADDESGMAYDGTTKTVTATVSNTQKKGEETDDVKVAVTGGAAVEVGEYVATATELNGSDAANYKLPEERTYTYRIAEKLLEIAWAVPENMEYDGTAKTVTYALTGMLEGEDCEATVENLTQINAGSYTAKVTGLSNPHYALKPADTTFDYEITRKVVELAWSGTEDLVYDGTEKNISAAVTNAIVVGDTTDEVTVTVTGGNEKNAGEWTATASGLSNTNYRLPEEATRTYTIAPKMVEITFTGYDTRTYNGTASAVTATVNAETLIGEDTAKVIVAGGDEKNAGTHTATATGLDNSNYALSGTLTQEYTINPLTAVLAWQNYEGLLYDAQPKNVTAIVANAAEGDAPTVKVEGGNAVEIGTYTAKAVAIEDPNYAMPTEGLEISYTITEDPAVAEVCNLIISLPDTVTLADKATVAAIRAAYEALTDAQKLLISSEVLNKLIAAEQQIAAEEAAAADPTTPPPPAPTVPTGAYTDPNGSGSYNIDASGNATFTKPAGSQATVTIPDTLTINDQVIPVTAIGDGAFNNNKKLTTVTIGKNVKTIGKKAFASCTSLKTVKGGKGVIRIKDSAFSGDKALKTIPTFDKLQTIDANAFKNCKELTKVTLAKGVKSIGKNAFNGCAKLKTITVKTEKLTSSNVKSGAFKGINKKATFKCPKKKKADYAKLFVKCGAPKTCKFK